MRDELLEQSLKRCDEVFAEPARQIEQLQAENNTLLAENAQLKAHIAKLEEELDLVNGHNFQLIEVMKSASDILNSIRARDGVPYSRDGYKYGISEDYFDLVVNAANQCISSTDSFIRNGGNECSICLKEELATLKAHNRQLVEFAQSIASFDREFVPCECCGNDVYLKDCDFVDEAKQALQTPPAKLSLAEAEVLRLLPEYLEASKTQDYGEYFDEFLVSKFDPAVEAMQEAKGDA